MIASDFVKKTKRLIIRFYQADDYELWKTTQENLPRARNQWDITPDKDFKGTRRTFNAMLKENQRDRSNERYYFIAIDRSSGQVIGHAIIYDIRRSVFHSGVVGCGIYNTYWGQGFGREMLEAIIQVGCKEIKLHRLEAAIEIKNKRSINLVKSAGMTREGIRRQFVYFEGEWKSLVIYSILSEDLGIKFKLP